MKDGYGTVTVRKEGGRQFVVNACPLKGYHDRSVDTGLCL